ncbi:hypothetical protein [Rugosimonospora africana]|uniref:Uncharacterized protein n=1 Tax=Rugosimonospora africana TaxID=556532 RepID=A0A8J3VMK0_9ACTN|nr:hypothetical protein [Rugosimonospora africana]GIH12085.1 hypothetical protein Raf01_02570 [Rugosimonospora africana]
MTEDELARAVDRLIDQVAQWPPSRWVALTKAGGSRAKVVHALAQRLADLEAGSTGHPRHEVPRLDNDLVLPDQVKVTARDLLAAGAAPDVLAEAGQAVADARAALNGS